MVHTVRQQGIYFHVFFSFLPSFPPSFPLSSLPSFFLPPSFYWQNIRLNVLIFNFNFPGKQLFIFLFPLRRIIIILLFLV